jgi:hypothetical protein
MKTGITKLNQLQSSARFWRSASWPARPGRQAAAVGIE